jgi:hypothetical protein
MMTETLIPGDQVARSVVVRDVNVEDGTVSGVVVNNSDRRLRDVRLVIRYDWLWNKEFSPGDNSPGRAVYYTLPEEIPPGGRVAFTYRPEFPLPSRTDGRFMASARVVGFTQFEEAVRR